MAKRSASSQSMGKAGTQIKRRRTTKRLKPKGTPEMYAKGQMFPDVLETTLRYNSNMFSVNPAAASTHFHLVLNGMYDFDYSNVLENKQPLFYDELLTADGPYRNYAVREWNTTIEIINDSPDPLLVYFAQSVATTETDSLTEIQNRQNVREVILTAKGGSKDRATIVAPGDIYSVWGKDRVNPESANGNYASNPSAAVYGTLYFYNPGGVVNTPVDCWVKVVHDFHATLSTADAISS